MSYRTGVTQAIISTLQARAGLGLRDITLAVKPSATTPATYATASAGIAATLSTLCTRGTVLRDGTGRNYTYTLNPTQLTAHRRGRPPAATQRPDHSPGPRQRSNPGMAALDRAARRAKTIAENREAERIQQRRGDADQAETVQEWLARGGRIEKLPNGASAHPLTTPMTVSPARRVGTAYPKRGLAP